MGRFAELEWIQGRAVQVGQVPRKSWGKAPIDRGQPEAYGLNGYAGPTWGSDARQIRSGLRGMRLRSLIRALKEMTD
jgi:hypothetical protein